MPTAPRCPLCEGVDLRAYRAGPELPLGAADVGSSRRSRAVGRILRCGACGLAFQAARPDAQALAELYRQMDVGVYTAETEGRRRTAEAELRIVQRYTRAGRLLDVGCASGEFLVAAQRQGFAVTGVEPSPALARLARERLAGAGEVIEGTLEAAPLPADAFDVVTLWDVLEHAPWPLALLRSAAARVAPGGLALANVPDLGSVPARLLGRRWPLLLPEHLNYFDAASLRACGERAGLLWVRSGQRLARFSLGYIATRLCQHGVPGAGLLRRMLGRGPSRWILPVPLGERWVAWRRAGSRG